MDDIKNLGEAVGRRKGGGVFLFILGVILLVPGILIIPILGPAFSGGSELAGEIKGAFILVSPILGMGVAIMWLFAFLGVMLLVGGIFCLLGAIRTFLTPKDCVFINGSELVLLKGFGKKQTIPLSDIKKVTAKRVRVLRSNIWMGFRVYKHGTVKIRTHSGKKYKTPTVKDADATAFAIENRLFGMQRG